jgi:hypothetical protein
MGLRQIKNMKKIKIMRSKYFAIILILFLFFFWIDFALAGSSTLQWNANTEIDLAGYKIYYGTTSRTGTDPKTCTMCGYSTKIDVGKVTTYTINNLTNSQTYYFSVTAYDTSNNESAFSSQVSKLISMSADFNSDGRINSVDFGIMMSNWGSTARPSSDINQDGTVNSVDFGILMSQWTG